MYTRRTHRVVVHRPQRTPNARDVAIQSNAPYFISCWCHVICLVIPARQDNFVQLWTVKNGADFCYPVSFALCIFHYPSRVPKVYQTLRRWRVWIHQLSEEAFLTRAFQDTGVLSESGNLCYLFIHANINDFRDIQIHVCQCNVGPNEIIHLYRCGFCCCCFFAFKKNDNGQRFGAD